MGTLEVVTPPGTQLATPGAQLVIVENDVQYFVSVTQTIELLVTSSRVDASESDVAEDVVSTGIEETTVVL